MDIWPWNSGPDDEVLCVKIRLFYKSAEAHSINFVANNTSIPVPCIITAFQNKQDVGYILMARCLAFPCAEHVKVYQQPEKNRSYHNCERCPRSFALLSPKRLDVLEDLGTRQTKMSV